MQDKKYFIPLGVKLTTIVSVLIALSLGGLTALATWFYGADIERTLRTNTLERVELLSRSLDSELSSYIKTGRLIAAAMEGGLIYKGTGKGPTEELLAQNAAIEDVYLVSRADGKPRILLHAGKGPAALDLQGPLASPLRKPLARSFAAGFSAVNLQPETGRPVIGLLFPYSLRTEGEAETVCLLLVSSSGLTATLAARELYVNYLVDADGNLLAHPDEALAAVRASMAGEKIVEDSLSSRVTLKQLQFTGSDGSVYIGSWQRFFGDTLTVVSTVRKDTALAGVYRLQMRNILITILILCLSMVFLFIFSKTITNPLVRLMGGAERIGQGDFSVDIPPTTHDEIGTLSTAFNAMAKGLSEREKIKSAFGKFVNKEIAERVLKGDIQLGGESRTAAIFFSDIRSFTAISEKLTPHEVVEFLNDYLTRMVSCVNRTHGTVDKYIGDAIMATWGIPVTHGNDTENAVNAALLMREALAEFNGDRGSEKKPIIRIGSGINTGEVIAGQIGSLERMEYTCIGDAVNFASRIESLNKPFHTDILISEHSHSLVSHLFRTVPMKKVHVKGKEEPQQIYAVLGRFNDPHGFHTIDELRRFLGYESIDLDEIDPDKGEEKYEIVE